MDGNISLKAGTIGGTLVTMLSVGWLDIERSLILCSIGAVTSFLVSLIMKRLFQRWESG